MSCTRVCSRPPPAAMPIGIWPRWRRFQCDGSESSSMPDAAAAELKSKYRVLGRTGEKVSPIGIGGWHLGLPKVEEKESLRIVRSAVDRGINFMDNSWDYNGGVSEIRMGKA